ncbi:MAG TPA: tRNA pseudouridine(55) synthase TruB [Burkholderiales bacterium]
MPGRDLDGVLLLDKPSGISSNAALQSARRLLGARRAGHTGTLDPMATGLLVLCFGEATKFSAALLDADKAYAARVRLGERTSTGDAEGEVLERREVAVASAGVDTALARFRGAIRQVPPMHSALKHQGRPLYAYARKGQSIERAPREVFVRELVLERLEGRDLDLLVRCSKGTYVRTLAEDLGEALGCGGHLSALRRTAVGPFGIEDALTLDRLATLPEAERARALLPVEVLLRSWPRVLLAKDAETRFRHGQRVAAAAREPRVAVFGADGNFLGIGEIDAEGMLKAKRQMAASAE